MKLHPLGAVWRVLSILAIPILLPNCASTPPDASTSEVRPTSVVTTTAERGPVGLLLRDISAEFPMDVVLMNGLELGQAGPYDFDKVSAHDVLQRIADDMGYETHVRPDYVFLYAPGYEALLDLSLEASIDRRAADFRVDIAIGSDTPLYSALALLGHAFAYTLVADNAIAGALCGEIHLRGASLTSALEALLQSARISGDVVRVESTPDYTFLASAGNRPRPPALIDAASVTREGRAILQRRVRVALPTRQNDPQRIEGQLGASTLEEILPELSAQLGERITAEASMAQLPVNPMLLIDLPIETVLELLIGQWLVPDFGYALEGNEIRLRRVP